MLQKVFDWTDSHDFSPAYYFEVLRSEGRGGQDAILLESDPAAPQIFDNRYSYVALDPSLSVKAKGHVVWINGVEFEKKVTDPFSALEEIMSEEKESLGYRRDVGLEGAPSFSTGGCIGYVGYDAKNWWTKTRGGERITTQKYDCNGKIRDDQGFADMYMMFPKTIIAFDHKEQKIYVTTFGDDTKSMQNIERVLSEDFLRPTAFIKERESKLSVSNEEIQAMSNMSFDEYIGMVTAAKEHIVSGNSYQVKLSQRLKIGVIDNTWNIYRRIRNINPSPFSAYLTLGGIDVVSCSPEELLNITSLADGSREAITRPIGGTYPRGLDEISDEVIIAQFWQDRKEVAEHRMLVDLERNDLGGICKIGSVPRENLKPTLESYSSVHHFVTTIPGILRDDVSVFDAFRAMFPGGTVTGCPKIRTMEIIDELEPTTRGPYTGSIGYLTFDGETQWNIMIRTLLHNPRNHNGFLQVGGGIVHDSNPKREWEETVWKAKALLRAV
jgi:para-aminobenzoate synthetase component I